jgi:hypothetical protein
MGNFMNLRKAAEMALELLENHVEDARCEVSICKTVAALRQALAITNPDRDSSYAGVRMWIGDKEIEYWVSKVCVEQEMIEGMSMKLAADSCLKALKESKHD